MNKHFNFRTEFYSLCLSYIKNIENFSTKSAIKYRNKKVKRVVNCISKKNEMFTYEEGKWNLKELIQHLIDYERIFIYKILLILRNEDNFFLFFNQNQYVKESNIQNRSSKSLKKELFSLYNSTYYFFENLSQDQLTRKIFLDCKFYFSVRTLVYIICGHALHHAEIIKGKYLKKKVFDTL